MRRKISTWWLAAAGMCLAFAALSARAQTPKSQPVSFKVETVKDGTYLVRVDNLSVSPITAAVVVATATLPDGRVLDRAVRNIDSIIYAPTEQSVGRYQSHTFIVWGPGGFRHANGASITVQRRAELKAAIFENGTTWGDPVWVARLLGARSQDLKFTTWLLAKTREASSSNAQATEVLASAKSEEARLQAAAPNTLERIIVEIVYKDFSLNLQDCLKEPMQDKNRQCLGQVAGRLMVNQGRLQRSRPAPEASSERGSSGDQ